MTAREASPPPEGIDTDAEAGLSETERRRRERQDARREAKRQKEELARIKRQMNQPRPRWLYPLLGIGMLLLLALAVGGYLFWSSHAINLSRKSFMDNYTVADLTTLRRYAPDRLRRVEELKDAAENQSGGLDAKEVMARYREADEALREARAAAQDNEVRYQRTFSEFNRLYDDAKQHMLDKHATTIWAQVEDARTTAVGETANTFSVQLAIEKLEQAVGLLEVAAGDYAALRQFDAAMSAFEKTFAQVNEPEWTRCIPDDFATIKLALRKAEDARSLSRWSESAQLYQDAAQLVAPALAKVDGLRQTAQEELDALKAATNAAETAGLPKNDPQAWRTIRTTAEQATDLFAQFDYRESVQVAKQALDLIGKADKDLLTTRETLAAALADVQELYAQARPHAGFFRSNWPDLWPEVERDYLRIPALTRQGDNTGLLQVASALQQSLKMLLENRQALLADIERLKQAVATLEADEATAFLEANYPQAGQQLFSLRRSVDRSEQRNQARNTLEELQHLHKVLQETLTLYRTTRESVRRTAADVDERRKRFQTGITAFQRTQLPLVNRLRRQLDTLGTNHRFAEAAQIAEQLDALVPKERFGSPNEYSVIDYEKGLMWVRDGQAIGAFNGRTLTWYEALEQTAGLSFAGFQDWRLPREDELQEIARLPAATRETIFPNTPNAIHWSSVPSLNVEDALGVDMETAQTVRAPKTARHHVRPVRSPR